MSALTVFTGKLENRSHENSSGFSTSPKTRKRHVFGSKRGTSPTCKTGKSRAMYCPGGRRPAYLSEAFVAIVIEFPDLRLGAGQRFRSMQEVGAPRSSDLANAKSTAAL